MSASITSPRRLRRARVAGLGYRSSIDGEGWPDCVTLENGSPVSEAFASVCGAASASMGAVSDVVRPALEAMRDAGLLSDEDEGGDAR